MRWASWPKSWFVSWTVELPGIAETVNTVKSWWRCKLVPTFSTYFDLVQAGSWEFLGIVARLGLFQHVLRLATTSVQGLLWCQVSKNRIVCCCGWCLKRRKTRPETEEHCFTTSWRELEYDSSMTLRTPAWFHCDLKLLTFGDYVSSLWFGMLQGAVCWKKQQSAVKPVASKRRFSPWNCSNLFLSLKHFYKIQSTHS